jgi:mono/diheme cytochrome c family protein
MARRLLLLVLAMAMMVPATARAQGGDDSQLERGRVVVSQVCTTCHTTLGRMLQVHKQTREEWRDLVFFMISRGAQVMPEEIDAVTAFLAANSGRERPAARSPGQPDARR